MSSSIRPHANHTKLRALLGVAVLAVLGACTEVEVRRKDPLPLEFSAKYLYRWLLAGLLRQ